MPAVLVHGVPETSAVWVPLTDRLDRKDVTALMLPGFGCARPEGFGATKEEYVSWLVEELEKLRGEGPIDLVGHDWGGGLAVRVVSTRPDLVRSWVTDAAGLGDENFAWHDLAVVWQTVGAGEAFFERQLALDPERRASSLEQFGVPREQIGAINGLDSVMADSILALYRSAVDVGREWGPDFHDIPVPGLVVVPSEDPYLAASAARIGAAQAGARVAELPGLGHWWILQDPAAGAALLEEFWATVS